LPHPPIYIGCINYRQEGHEQYQAGLLLSGRPSIAGDNAAGIRILFSLLFDLAFEGPSSINQANFVQQQLSLGLAMLVI